MSSTLLRRLACLAILALIPPCLAAPGFRFAWLSDTHVGSSGAADDLAASVRDINTQPDLGFVILSGDITDLGSRAELTQARDILGGLRAPLHIIPGNHDTKWSESGATDFPRIFGDERFVFEHQGYLFVGMHEGPVMRMSNGHFAPQDIRWLRETLEARAQARRPVIFVTHYPIDDSITNWFEVLDLLKRYNTQVALFGHGHNNRPQNLEGLPGVMTRANIHDAKRPAGYSIVTVADGRMTVAERRPATGETLAAWHTVSLIDRERTFTSAPRMARPDFEVNAAHSSVKPRWVVDTGWTIISAPAVWNQTVITGDASGCVRTFAVDSGKPGWTFQTGGPIRGTPCVAGDRVVVTSTDGSVYALDAAGGTVCWRFRTDRPIVACPLVADGVVYIGASDGRFRALALADGALRWEFKGVKGFVETRPLVFEGRVYFGAWDRTFYALDARTGDLAWTWQGKRPGGFYSPAACWPVAAAGKVFIVDPRRVITALDAKTGAEVWQYAENAPARESIGISEDGQRIYVPAMQDVMRAFATTSSKPQIVWETNAKFGADYNTVVVTERDGVAFYGTKTGVVIAFDAKTGSVRWRHRLGVGALNTIVPLSANEVVVTDHSGRVALVGRAEAPSSTPDPGIR